ncbi:hypothetical protein HL42_6125 [Trichophyton rubrum]|nr:hypothetical protein HL42_6125 [Trichophyton rubrum]
METTSVSTHENHQPGEKYGLRQLCKELSELLDDKIFITESISLALSVITGEEVLTRHRELQYDENNEHLCDQLIKNPGLYLDEMAAFIRERFNVSVTISTLSRALASIGWSREVARQVAKERNADLRDSYLHDLSSFCSYHPVFVDESGCDKRVGSRRTGWAPVGVTPTQVSRFHRGQRYQILPAYAQYGIVLSRIFQGTTDASRFEDFIEQLLEHCGRWPDPKSVLIMDNASFHHSEQIEKLCADKGVKLIYLPPYSPDLNPIEEFFAELKSFIRRNWQLYVEHNDEGFDSFLK